MPVLENKSKSCVDCGYVFDEFKKFHSKDRCNACYQKSYNRNKFQLSPKREKETHCKECKSEYDTLNHKGKPILRGSKGLCRSCYHKLHKPEKVCNSCGNIMKTGSITGLCAVCKRIKSSELPRSKYKKKQTIPVIQKEQFELIRRLLVRYKLGMNNMADAFRVIDVYMDVNDNPILLDTLTESAQLVEMLRNLKSVFDYNLELQKTPKKLKYGTPEYRREYYLKNKEKLKRKRLLKDGL